MAKDGKSASRQLAAPDLLFRSAPKVTKIVVLLRCGGHPQRTRSQKLLPGPSRARETNFDRAISRAKVTEIVGMGPKTHA
jgi:hypothetical protein